MDKIKVLGIIISPAHVILYKEDGSEIKITQGNIRDAQVIHDAVKDIESKGFSYITLTSTQVAGEFGIYGKTGVARFFRVARKFIEDLFSDDEDTPDKVVGKIPEPEPAPTLQPSVNAALGDVAPEPLAEEEDVPEPEDALEKELREEALAQEKKKQKVERSKTKHKKAVADILGNSPATRTPASDHLSANTASSPDEITVAVVGDTVIPNADALTSQVKHAVGKKDYKGMDNLLARLAKIIHSRQHSVEDLLSFLRHADLPIMDDGSILAYKRVKSTGDARVFVDCHSKKVKQWVGCKVFMPPEKVDDNRRASCSHGLHVASRSYLGGFTGDTILFLKIAPEDVIAVPVNEHNKVRVSSYAIIGKANAGAYSALLNNQPISDDATLKTISMYLAGNHIAVTDTAEIRGERGTDIVYTAIKNTPTEAATPTAPAVPQTPLPIPTESSDGEVLQGESVSPKVAVRAPEKASKPKKAEPDAEDAPKPKRKASAPAGQKRKKQRAAKAKVAKEKPAKAMKPRDHIIKILPVTTKEQAEECLLWKRKAKKGWRVLGVPEDQETVIKNFLKK